MKQTLKGFLIGGLVGGIGGFLFVFGIDIFHFLMNHYSDETKLTVSGILFISLLLSFILSIKNLRKSERKLSINNTDDDNIKLINVFNKSSMFAAITLPLSLLWFTCSLIFFDRYLIVITVMGLIFLVLSTWLCRKTVILMPRIYNADYEYDPERKDMNRIWINSMDEGERLITLQSLFNCYSALILLSSFSILILAGYSVLAESNQLLGILLIGLTMIISTLVYYRTAAKYNQ